MRGKGGDLLPTASHTLYPRALKKASLSRKPHACVVQPEVFAWG